MRYKFLTGLLAAAGIVVADPIISPIIDNFDLESLVSEAEARPPQRSRRSINIDDVYRSIANDRKINILPLEQQIELFIFRLRESENLNANDQTSIYVYDIKKQFTLADINIDEQHMSASLIKVYVMAAVYDKLQKRNLSASENKIIRSNLERMIRRSNNQSTNYLINFVGGPAAVQRYIDSTRLFTATQCSESIPKDGRTYRNKTSAHDLNIFLNQLYNGNIVSKIASQKMLEIMAGYRTSIFDAIEHKGVRKVAGKTGHVAGLTGESAIMYYQNHAGQYRPYALTVMLENDGMKNASGKTKTAWTHKTDKILKRISDLVASFYQRDLADVHRDGASFDQRVKEYERYYLDQGINNADSRIREMGRQYVNTIQKAAEKFDVGWRDLYSLLLVESGFRKNAFSQTGTSGIAQLSYDTGILNDLKINKNAKGEPCGRYQDERCNPTKAIYAAAQQLNRLYNQALNNVTVSPTIARTIALASYNSGYNSGFAATERILNAQQEIDYRFLELTQQQKEYNDYVPRIMAVRNIIFGN